MANDHAVQILVVGAADTGRGPMTAAFLRRMLIKEGRDWPVASAGVVGHDDDPAEPEARNAMVTMGLDLSFHQARSLTDELAAQATILLTVDSGVARVLRARYPELVTPIISLGELAGTRRDIPDPFRMQIGAWISYANEIEDLLRKGLARLIGLIEGQGNTNLQGAAEPAETVPAASDEPAAQSAPMPPVVPAARSAALERIQRLLGLLADFPGVIDWANARRQLNADLATIGATPLAEGDMSQAYCAMLLALLETSPAVPAEHQQAILAGAIERLAAAIDARQVNQFLTEIGQWGDHS